MTESPVTKIVLKNFLASVEGAIGTSMFRHLYVRDETNRESDVLENGKLSCAYAVSSLLTLYGLIDAPHATVATTLKRMAESGWRASDAPHVGAVAYWPEYEGNEHIGFVVSERECVSNSSKEGTPIRHGMTLSTGVEATKFYLHPTLIGEK